MWEHYRKTFIPIQIVILVICLALNLFLRVPISSLLPFVVMMELFSILGARWAVRLKGKIDRERGMLPRQRS